MRGTTNLICLDLAKGNPLYFGDNNFVIMGSTAL